MESERRRDLICCRCGDTQPPAGPLRAHDGTPISLDDYLALAQLAGSALVCSACVAADDGVAQPERARPRAHLGHPSKNSVQTHADPAGAGPDRPRSAQA